MALRVEGVCAHCKQPDNPAEQQVVPKVAGWMHFSCYTSLGETAAAVFDRMPCCSTNATVRFMGGYVMQPDGRVPKDEIWLFDPKLGQLRRLKILSNGFVQEVPRPEGGRYQKAPEAEGETPETGFVIPPEGG